MGSHAYGVSTDQSDADIYGFCTPEKQDVFTHLKGVIPGFDKQVANFKLWQQPHVTWRHNLEPMSPGVAKFDFNIYSIIEFFSHAMRNTPNVLDCLFVPVDVITFRTKLADMVLERRKLFLHKGAKHRYLGFAHSQLDKMRKLAAENEAEKGEIATFKQNARQVKALKHAYHAVRLCLQVRQLLADGDMQFVFAQYLREIRSAKYSYEVIVERCAELEVEIEELYATSNAVPYKPDEPAIKELLLNCLEEAYGSLDGCVARS